MPKVDIWMPLYIGDYLGDTMHLEAAEHGAYLLLIMHYWMNGPLPDNDRRLRGIAKLSADQWLESRETIAEFFELTDGYWHHERIESEKNKAEARRVASSVNGKKGGRPRKKQPSEETQKKPIGFDEETHSLILGEPRSNLDPNLEKSSSPSPSPTPSEETSVPEERVGTEVLKNSVGGSSESWGVS